MNPPTTAGSASRAPPTTRPHARVTPTNDNPRGYPPFDMRLVPSYTNNQLTYYFTTGAIPAADQAEFQQLMKDRKDSLQLLGWDGASNDEAPGEASITPANENSDSDCPVPPPDYRGIKINPSDIPKLAYNSTVAQYNNWLADLKIGFDGDPARFPTSRQKVILASITLDEQLKTTFNSAARDTPVLSYHWRKFKNWLQDVVLHGGSDKLKLSKEFTTAHQLLKEDPNQFDLDPARFPTSRQKVILASITLDEQLKTTFNSAARDTPVLSYHWRKFKNWLQDVVLHGGSDKLKLSKEFTTAHQLLKEDPNQFYLRL